MKLPAYPKHKPAVAERLGACEVPRPLVQLGRDSGGLEKEIMTMLREVV